MRGGHREFFLEMTRCVQFPLHMSLPWLLLEHALEHPDATPLQLHQTIFALLVRAPALPHARCRLPPCRLRNAADTASAGHLQ